MVGRGAGVHWSTGAGQLGRTSTRARTSGASKESEGLGLVGVRVSG